MDNQKKTWIWAVGFEDTFIAQTARGERPLDEFELTGHYVNWREDLDRARASGATMIRYGIPWYKVEPEPGTFDWSWVDGVIAYFDQHRELTPIIDLMHYGTPLWLQNEFMNGQYPKRVAQFAAAFVERYQQVTKYYTPLNEAYINAEWCGWTGIWPPYLKGHLGFMLVMNQLCKGIIYTEQAIRQIQADVVVVHVEASKKYISAEEGLEQEVALWNEIRYVMWELIQGNIDDGHPLYKWITDHGVSGQDLDWYGENAIEPDIIGINYYPQFSVNAIIRETIEQEHIPQPVPGSAKELIEIAADMFQRYRKPIFITETSYRGTIEERIAWMEELFEACHDMAGKGIDLYGVTWFPFFDMIHWSYRTNGLPIEQNLDTFGLYTLVKQPDGTFHRVKNAAAGRFEAEVRRMKQSEAVR